MKLLTIALVILLCACGPESSPEGRSKLRDEKIQKQIDTLKYQNQAILDSLAKINEEVKKLRYGIERK